MGGHVDDPRHVTLHHDVVPLRRDARLRQQVPHVREVHRSAVEVVVGVVVVLGLLHPPADGDLVDAPDLLRVGGVDHLRPVECAVTVVEDDLDGRLPRAVCPVPVGVPRVVDQVRQLLGSDSAGACQPQREEDAVDDVRLAGAVRPRDDREVLVEGNLCLPPEALEVV